MASPSAKTKGIRLEGEHVYLRDVGLEDVGDAYLGWMNDPEVSRYLESRFIEHTRESLRAYVADTATNPDTVFLAICERDGNRHVGNLKLGPIDWIHGSADIGIVIGERTSWGRGYASEAIGLLSEYAFTELGLHKVTAGCYEPNTGSRRAFARAGFAEEGRRPGQRLLDDRYVDEILMGRLAGESS